MDPDMLWNLFVETGAPEIYLMFCRVRHEAEPVSA